MSSVWYRPTMQQVSLRSNDDLLSSHLNRAKLATNLTVWRVVTSFQCQKLWLSTSESWLPKLGSLPFAAASSSEAPLQPPFQLHHRCSLGPNPPWTYRTCRSGLRKCCPNMCLLIHWFWEDDGIYSNWDFRLCKRASKLQPRDIANSSAPLWDSVSCKQ